MRKEFSTTNAKFVYSKNELGYQEVLDHFDAASKITIITFNISEKNDALVRALSAAGEHCAITIITNVPSRWEYYYGDSVREKSRNKIHLYLSKLKPEKFGIKPEIYFDFSNHGKIIMTDKIVYVGSANYSEESANNTEFGFISTDEEFINYINSEVLPDMQSSAIPYYEYDYTALLLEANLTLSSVYNAKNELYEEVYHLHDDIDGEWYYYVEDEALLSADSLERVIGTTKVACNIACDIYDAIDTITSGNEDELSEANRLYEELRLLCSHIELIASEDTLIELSEFDWENFINQQLQEKYAMEAYEDNLENCITSASSEAMSIVRNLTLAAKNDIEGLISQIDKFCSSYSELIENLRLKGVKKISGKIDNT